MYAIVSAGGKQHKVVPGQVIRTEWLGAEGSEVSLRPVLLVDDETMLASPEELLPVEVTAQVLEEVRAKKIVGFKYKSKSNQRRRWGHRQRHSLIRITSIERPKGARSKGGSDVKD